MTGMGYKEMKGADMIGFSFRLCRKFVSDATLFCIVDRHRAVGTRKNAGPASTTNQEDVIYEYPCV